MMNSKKIIFFLFSVVLGIVFNRFVTIELIDYFNPDFQFIEYISLIVLQIGIWYEILNFFFDKWTYKDKWFIFICYLIILLIVLLDRPVIYYANNFVINPIDSLSVIFSSLRNVVVAIFNILLFMPFIVLSGLLFHDIKKCMIAALMFGFLVEILQAVLHRGIFDAADITLYLIGIILGECVYAALRKKSHLNSCVDFKN